MWSLRGRQRSTVAKERATAINVEILSILGANMTFKIHHKFKIWTQAWPSWVQVGPCWAKLGPCWSYVGLCWRILGPCWAMLGNLDLFPPPPGGILERTWAPSWPQVGPSWEQVRPSWGQDAPCWRQVGPSWRQNGTSMGFQRDFWEFSRNLLICIDFSSDLGSIVHHFRIRRNLNFSVFA